MPRDVYHPRAAFTLETSRGFHIGDARSFLTSASKFNTELNGGIFDVSPKNDRATLNVKTLILPPLGSMLKFNADVKKKKNDRASPNVKTASHVGAPCERSDQALPYSVDTAPFNLRRVTDADAHSATQA